jgi:hypothetical protein
MEKVQDEIIQEEKLTYTERTLNVVHAILRTEVSDTTATDLISHMQNAGILFRERA